MLLAAAAVAAGVQAVLVKMNWEREVFAKVARAFANPPLFTEGDGSDDNPFGYRAQAAVTKIDRAKAPVVVSIGDDPDGVFQESPPAPADIAIVLRNLHRLGARNAAVAAVLAWQEPDLTAFKALEIALGKFEMVVHAAPLARHTLRQEMPEAFARAALPPEALTGDVSRLPIINRVAVADMVFAPGKGVAGFSTLDNVELKGRVPMLARWEEDPDHRVVLAFPLLAVLARYELPIGGVKVRLGEAISLGPNGPLVPIDADGCLALPPKPVASRADVAAEAILQGEKGIFPDDPGLIVLRDDQSWASAATRRFSRDLSSVMAAIGSDGGLVPAVSYHRVSGTAVLTLAGFLLAGMGLACGLGRFGRNVVFGLLLGYVAITQFLSFGLAELWFPGVPSALGLLAGWGMCGLLGHGRASVAAEPTPEAVATPPPVPESAARRASIRSVTIWREPAAPAAIALDPPVESAQTEPEIVDEAPSPEPEPPPAPVSETVLPPEPEAPAPKKRATRPSRAKRQPAPEPEPEPPPVPEPESPKEPEPPPPAAKRTTKRTVAKKSAPAVNKVSATPPPAAEPEPPPAKKATRRRKSAASGNEPDAPDGI